MSVQWLSLGNKVSRPFVLGFRSILLELWDIPGPSVAGAAQHSRCNQSSRYSLEELSFEQSGHHSTNSFAVRNTCRTICTSIRTTRSFWCSFHRDYW
eukprot:s64_g9.t1